MVRKYRLRGNGRGTLRGESQAMRVNSAKRRRIDARAQETAMAELINAERARAGLAPLKRRGNSSRLSASPRHGFPTRWVIAKEPMYGVPTLETSTRIGAKCSGTNRPAKPIVAERYGAAVLHRIDRSRANKISVPALELLFIVSHIIRRRTLQVRTL